MGRLFLTALVAAAACGGDGGTSPSTSLTGTWDITLWERADIASPTRDDLLADGYSGAISIGSSGAFTLDVTFPDGSSGSETGTITVEGNTLTYDGQGDEVEYGLTLRSREMTWVARETELWDADDDGVPEETRETVGFTRR